MRYGFKRRLDIAGYAENAAKNFSLTRIIVFTLLSLVLTILLLVTSIQAQYEGTAMLFTGLVFFAILGYTILNIKALIIKIKKSK